MQRIPNPEKELVRKIIRLEKSLHKAMNDSMREAVCKEIDKLRKELDQERKSQGK